MLLQEGIDTQFGQIVGEFLRCILKMHAWTYLYLAGMNMQKHNIVLTL